MSGLASWNERAARAAIEAYVATVTSDGPDFVPPDGRVAVFDNDGTLWCEKPMPVQLDYTVRRFEEMAEADASLRDTQPWKAAYEQDLEWMATAMVKHYHGDNSDLASLMAAVPRALEGLSVDQYAEDVRRFIHEAVQHQLARSLYLGPQSPLAGAVARQIAVMTGVERVCFCSGIPLRVAHFGSMFRFTGASRSISSTDGKGLSAFVTWKPSSFKSIVRA